MPRPSNTWLSLLFALVFTVLIVLLIVDLAGGPDVLGWTTTLIFSGIVLWLAVPELRRPQTRAMRVLLWLTLTCAVVLIVGTLVEQVVT